MCSPRPIEGSNPKYDSFSASAAKRMASSSPEVLAFEPEGEPAGGCQVYAVKTKGLWSPLTYRSKRCRTTTGYRDTLIESDAFKTMTSEWTVTAAGEGATKIAFVGDLELSFPVPKKLLSSSRVKGMQNTLTKLQEAAKP